MATVLVAMLGYSLLFAGMLLLDATPVLIGVFGAFFAFVAVGQALAIRSGKPREASIIAGAVFWVFVAIAMPLNDGIGLDPCAYVAGILAAVIAGPISGYLAGTLVGGVFLVSHYLREASLLRRRGLQGGGEEVSPWGPLPKPLATEPDDYEWPVMIVVDDAN